MLILLETMAEERRTATAPELLEPPPVEPPAEPLPVPGFGAV